MTLATPVRAGVSLDELLAAKERRAARQADMLAHYQQPVISLTLVTPGEIKDSLRYRNTMGVALQMCDQLLWENRWPVLDRQVLCSRPGQKPVVRGPSGGGNQSALCGSGADAPARQAVGSGRDLPSVRPRRASVAGGKPQTLPDLRRARSRLLPFAKASC